MSKNTKKASFNFTGGKLFMMMIMIIVIIFLLPNIAEGSSYLTKKMKMMVGIQSETLCDANDLICKDLIKNCDKENDCSSKEKEMWEEYKTIKDCNQNECSETEKTIWNEFLQEYFSKELNENKVSLVDNSQGTSNTNLYKDASFIIDISGFTNLERTYKYTDNKWSTYSPGNILKDLEEELKNANQENGIIAIKNFIQTNQAEINNFEIKLTSKDATVKYKFEDNKINQIIQYHNTPTKFQLIETISPSNNQIAFNGDVIENDKITVTSDKITFKDSNDKEYSATNYNIFNKNLKTTSTDLNFKIENSGFNENAIKAIIKTETSNSKGFDSEGFPIVRFECHIFNKQNPSETMPCTIDKDKGFSTTASQTNKAAFLKAYEIDSDKAIYSTSFGLGQIMGFNYKKAGYSSLEEFYKAMQNSEEDQTKAMIAYLTSSSSTLQEELKKEDNINWDLVAENYNGENYKENKYAEKLENNYNQLIS